MLMITVAVLFAGSVALAEIPAHLCADSEQNSSFSVLYAGRFLGYFHVPDKQPVEGAPDTSHIPDPVQKFAQLVAAFCGTGNQLLVGMGDIFAPELDSRVLFNTNGTLDDSKDVFRWQYLPDHPIGWIPAGKTLSTNLAESLAAGNGVIGFDNVAWFLRRQGFDAVVPGAEDFYFGPERLRELARLLASKDGGGQPVQMLASNLTIVSTVHNANPRIPDAYKRDRGYVRNSSHLQVVLPDFVLPSLRRFGIRSADGAPLDMREVRIRLVENPPPGPGDTNDPDALAPCSIALANCIDLESESPRLSSLRATVNLPPQYHLRAGSNYHLCITEASAASAKKLPEPYCVPFSVLAPFFQYRRPMPGQPAITDPAPWAVRTVRSGAGPLKVIVFGVVDPDILKAVGLLNYSWLNTKSAHDTQVKALDPESALKQVLEDCALSDCKGTRHVLLAEMAPYKAQELAARMKGDFDLVITQPDSLEHTQAEEISRPVPAGREAPPFVVVPDPQLARSGTTIDVRLQRASLDLRFPPCGSRDCGGKAKLVNEWEECDAGVSPSPAISAPCPNSAGLVRLAREPEREQNQAPVTDCRSVAAGAPRPLYCLLQETVPSITLKPGSPRSATVLGLVQDAALSAMRRRFHADLAFMQQRDIYAGARQAELLVTPETLQEALDRIYWKGDFAISEPLTGATINALISQSKVFAAQEESSINPDPERSRALLALGVFQNDELGKLVIDGEAADDTKLYSVAMTDYLEYGDTGYAALTKPAVPATGRVNPDVQFFRISGLICERIKAVDERWKSAVCNSAPLTAAEYFDRSDQIPFDTTAGITPARRVEDWLRLRELRDIYSGISDPVERNTQQRPVWSLTLEKADLSYMANQHNNGTEANLASRFEGVTVSPVTAPDSTSFGADWRMRASRSGRLLKWFAASEMNYALQRVRQITSDAYVASQTANRIAAETGVMPRLAPVGRKQSASLFLLTSAMFESQFRPPITTLIVFPPDLIPGTTTPNVFVLTGAQPRTERISGKLGIRFEDARSWLEAGFKPGTALNAPYGYQFTTSEASISCYALERETMDLGTPTEQSLYNCLRGNSSNPVNPTLLRPGTITAASAFHAIGRDRYQNGLFLNFHAAIPLPFQSFGRNTWLVMDNHGDYYVPRRGDASLDTRYFEDISNSLVIPLFGNLSLSPKIELFFYENQVDAHPFHTAQTTISLQYRFDWHEGLGFWNALRYPSPQPGL